MKIYSPVTMGINVNDSENPWTDLILDGKKTIETRNSNSLKAYIGKRVGVIQTSKGKAKLVGFVTVGEPIVYQSQEDFQKDESKHLVSSSSSFKFPGTGVKYGYPLYNPTRCDPIEINSKGYVARYIGDMI